MILAFLDSELDLARLELRRDGIRVPIESRIFDLIAYLAQNSDRVVSKREIFEQVWAGRVVTEGSLTVAISAARRALGDDADSQQVIRTYKGRGYRFLPTPSQPEHPEASTTDFVGRAPHVEAFSALATPNRNHSSILLLEGEPGIGKSRLLSEFSSLSAARHVSMHVVSCPETERTPFLWPCLQLLRRLADDARSLRTLLPRDSARFLGPLLPDVFAPISAELSPDPDTARFQVLEPLARAFRAASRQRTQVLAIDDFHRADEGTAQLIPLLVAELRDTPTVFVITFRPHETSRAPLHSFAVSALAREPHSATLVLEGLDLQSTAELAAKLTKREVPEFVRVELFHRTGGNPFYIRQLLALLERDPCSWARLAPSTLSQAIQARVRIMSLPAQELLSACAVFGREFEYRALAAVVNSEELASSLREVIDAGLLAHDPGRPGWLAFAHVLVRDVVYEALSSSDRSSLHQRIADSIDSADCEVSEARAAQLAGHLLRTNALANHSRALELSELAGKLASQRSAHEDAAHHFQIALDALELLASPLHERKCRLLLSLGEAQCRAGNRALARSTFNEAARLATVIGAWRQVAAAALGVAPGLLAAEAGVSDSALELLLADAMAMLDDAETDLRALLAARLAMALHWDERSDAVAELMRVARRCRLATDDRRVHLHVGFAEWFCCWQSDDIEGRHRLASEVRAIAEDLRDQEMALVGSVLCMVSMLERANISAFDRALAGFEERATTLRQPRSLWYASMYRAMRALMDGRLREVEPNQHAFLAIASKVNDANAFHSYAAQTVLYHQERGTLESSLDGLVEGANRYPAVRGFRAGISWAYAKTGRLDHARQTFGRLFVGETLDVRQRYDWSAVVGLASETCAYLGDRRRAKILYDMLLPYQGHALVLGLGVVTFGAADRLLALLAETLGRVDQAEWHFERALELNESTMPVWAAHTKLDYSRFLIRHRRGRQRAARELVIKAHEFGRSTESRGIEASAQELLGQL